MESDETETNMERQTFSLEEILQNVGEYGHFHKILLIILFMTCLPASYQILLVYFSTIVPPWKCVSNSTICVANDTLSPDDFSRCNMPRNEWYYTESERYSLVTQFHLQCDDEWLLHLASSMIFIGWGFGAFILGWIGDNYGRRSVLYPSISVIIVVGFCAAFVTNIYQVMICQTIIGFFIPGAQLQSFILISELVGFRYRALAGLVVYMGNPIGWCVVATKAYLIKDWRIQAMVCTLPYIFIFAFFKFVPESIRWLHLHDKKTEVKEVLGKVAKWNKRVLPSKFDILPEETVVQEKTNPLDLFRTRWLASITLVQAFLWMVLATCYYGLHMAANDLGGSVYRDFIILTMMDIPGFAIAIFCCDYLGRKRTTLIPSFLGSMICIVLAFIPQSEKLKVLRVALGVAGNFFMSIAFNAVYPWSVEIFPLHIRSEGMGFLQAAAHWGSASAPWVIKGLKRYGTWCPFFALGVPAFVASLAALWLRDAKKPHKATISRNYNTINNEDTERTSHSFMK